MITIITKSKRIRWNYKRLLSNLFVMAGLIFMVLGYLYISNMEYQSLIK